MSKDRKNSRARSKWSELFSAVLFLVIGILMLSLVTQFVAYATVIIGGALILIGAFNILKFVFTKDKRASDIFTLIYGVLALIGAAIVFLRAQLVLDWYTVILGVYIVFAGLLRVRDSVRTHKETDNKVWPAIVLACVEIICGVICLLAKKLMPDSMIQCAGAMMTVYSIADIAFVIRSALASRKTGSQA